jgi:hypothetical protein
MEGFWSPLELVSSQVVVLWVGVRVGVKVGVKVWAIWGELARNRAWHRGCACEGGAVASLIGRGSWIDVVGNVSVLERAFLFGSEGVGSADEAGLGERGFEGTLRNPALLGRNTKKGEVGGCAWGALVAPLFVSLAVAESASCVLAVLELVRGCGRGGVCTILLDEGKWEEGRRSGKAVWHFVGLVWFVWFGLAYLVWFVLVWLGCLGLVPCFVGQSGFLPSWLNNGKEERYGSPPAHWSVGDGVEIEASLFGGGGGLVGRRVGGCCIGGSDYYFVDTPVRVFQFYFSSFLGSFSIFFVVLDILLWIL